MLIECVKAVIGWSLSSKFGNLIDACNVHLAWPRMNRNFQQFHQPANVTLAEKRPLVRTSSLGWRNAIWNLSPPLDTPPSNTSRSSRRSMPRCSTSAESTSTIDTLAAGVDHNCTRSSNSTIELPIDSTASSSQPTLSSSETFRMLRVIRAGRLNISAMESVSDRRRATNFLSFCMVDTRWACSTIAEHRSTCLRRIKCRFSWADDCAYWALVCLRKDNSLSRWRCIKTE